MTITRKQLRNAVVNAEKLGNTRDASVIRDLASSLKKWGKLTSRQAEFAAALVERNSNEKVRSKELAKADHERKWREDGAYREWVLFLATFFLISRQSAYGMHIDNRKPNARNVLRASKHPDGKPPVLYDCTRLTSSKLAPRLRDTFEKPLLYSVGDLVQVRASELGYGERGTEKAKEMGFIIDVDATVVHRVATYSKSKGGTRTYKIMFPSGEQLREEREIKLVSRKKRGK